MTALAISARGLNKRFGGVHAVADLTLDVPVGSTFGLIGPNGAGKTTFIKLLLGIVRPNGGDISVLGGSPDDVGVRRRIGYLPERLTLPAAFTPVAFLKSVGRLKGLSRRDLEDAVPRLLNMVELEESAWSRTCGKFSKGMKQRTGLAAALLGDPELLILDEPTDGIDPMGRAHIRQVIQAAHQRGATVFLNSHLLAETERLCDHVAILHRGSVALSGATEALRSESRYRVRFAPGPDVDAAVSPFGFVPDAQARKSGAEGSFDFEGTDLSAALAGAIGAGAKVVEVSPRLKDLETVLTETVSSRMAPSTTREARP